MKWWKGKDLVEVEKMKAASPARKEIEEWVISNNVTLKKNESYTYVYGETEKVTNTKGGHLIWIEIYVQCKVEVKWLYDWVFVCGLKLRGKQPCFYAAFPNEF